MSSYRIYAYIVIGCILGGVAAMAGHGLGIATGIACGAGVAVALAYRPRGGAPRGRCGPRSNSRPPAPPRGEREVG